MAEVYKATYSQIDVYESIINGLPLMRRCDDNWVNATQILKVAGFGKTQRTRILEREVHQFTHRKVQGGHGKFQGTWVPLEFAQEMAVKHKIERENLNVLYFDPAKSPEIAQKTKSTTKASKSNSNKSNTPIKNSSIHNNHISNKKRVSNSDITDSFNDAGVPSQNFVSGSIELPKKLNSPQKMKKMHSSTPLKVEPLTLPPTFGMYNESPRRLHAKSMSASHISHSMSELTSTPNSAPPISSHSIRANASFYGHNVQAHQLKAQRELQYFQQQQNSFRSPNLQNAPRNDPMQYHQSHANDSVISADNSQIFHNESIVSQNSSYIPVDVNNSFVKPRNNTNAPYQQFRNNIGDSNYNNNNSVQLEQHQIQSRNQKPPAIIRSQSKIYQSPGGLYKHSRHHSSPHINTDQTNLIDSAMSSYNENGFGNSQQFDEFLDNQEYYTVELLSFFVNDTEIPSFLYNPPSDFNVNKPIDEEGHTPLHWASALASVEIIKLLFNLNADTLILNIHGMNALSKLIHFNNSFDWKNFHIILPMLKHCLVVPDANQKTPVHYLAELSGNPNKVSASLYYMENILTFIKAQQDHAEKFNDTNNDRKLLDVIINHPNLDGETALQIALRSNCKEFIILLLRNGADVSQVGGLQNIHPSILRELNINPQHYIDPSGRYDVIIDQQPGVIKNQASYNVNSNNYGATSSSEQMTDYSLLQPGKVNQYNESIHNSQSMQTNPSAIVVDEKNPFLENPYKSNMKYKVKDTPHTIEAQRTPESETDDFENKEKFMTSNASIKNNRNDTLLSPTPSKLAKGKLVDSELTVSKIKLQDEKPLNMKDDLEVKKSTISFEELDSIVHTFPKVVSELKSTLENKTDQLTYNIDTINNLNSNIKSITSKNSKLLKKIAKCGGSQEISKIDFNKIANSDPVVITNFVNHNLSNVENEVRKQRKHLHDLYERSQALEVAKLVNHEENNIVENSKQPKSKKLELAVQLTLLQIMRRKIIEKTLSLHVDEESNNNDFCFDESVLDSTISKTDADNFRSMKSKLSVYKKLIANICGLPSSEISNELLNEIEKIIS